MSIIKEKTRVKRGINIAGNVIFALLIVTLLSYALLSRYAPYTAARIFPYHAYAIATDSMEPTIPAGSMVLVKRAPAGLPIEPGSIITFRADRFGQSIILTHYLARIDYIEGEELFRTRAEGTDELDIYETRRVDVLGTYVRHIPGMGKFAIFINSSYAVYTLAVIIIILLVGNWIRLRVDREGLFVLKGIRVKALHMKKGRANEAVISGKISNASKSSLKSIVARMDTFRDKEMINSLEWELIPKDKPLHPNNSLDFAVSVEHGPDGSVYRFSIAQITFGENQEFQRIWQDKKA